MIDALTAEAREEVFLDLVLMRGREAMRRARIIDLLRNLDKASRLLCIVFQGNDLVVFAVQNQHRNVDPFQVFRLVCFRKREESNL